jgi:Domain of unknown function (DUF6265)
MTMVRTLLAVAAFLLASMPHGVRAQTANTIPAPSDAPGPRAALADVAWLAGEWVGTGLGGVSEETWSAPAAGAMMGMYRLIVDGKVSFYEFMNLVEADGSLVLKLKHFNPDLTGWEEKDRFVSFRLAKIAPDQIWFGGLTFRRLGPDRLEIFLALRGGDGSVREERFLMERRRRGA